jgi:23S rRNA (adenine2503-C2)-methyltransferase
VGAWADLSDVPAELRTQLAERFRLSALELRVRRRSSDGTTKLLLAAGDGQTIETVLIPAERAEGETGRLTVCVSSQAGCALACGFCATGQMGLARNLAVGEILEQVYWAEPTGAERRVDNVVFMGMGEPLANYGMVVPAIRMLADPMGYAFSPRRITVSTSGLVPQMRHLADEGLEVRLAVSLHAPDDDLRSHLMPINRRYPIAQVIGAAAEYAQRSGRRVSYEYVMLSGVNDADEQGLRLARLLRTQHAHVNLIPYNETSSGYAASAPGRIRAFARVLREHGVASSIRASRGVDIAAACGQLKATDAALLEVPAAFVADDGLPFLLRQRRRYRRSRQADHGQLAGGDS